MISRKTQPKEADEFTYIDKMLIRHCLLHTNKKLEEFYEQYFSEGKSDKEIYLFLDDLASNMSVTLHEIEKKDYI